ncbi:MAG: PQQ-dependent sugar dehydrogenase [Phycisphaerales bacterium]|nr:PQQ-dependent sugar dehydrogenase [Phycisphaerales bacterium]
MIVSTILVCLVCIESPGIPAISIEPALPGRSFREPVQVLSMPGTSDAVTVVERGGRVLNAPFDPASEQTILLDLRGRLTTRNSEEGLLSIAFHPKWPESPHLYVYRSRKSPRRTVLSRFSSMKPDGSIDVEKEEVLLEIEQPWGNHNGGTVLFGPDGMLYLSVGDGGAANDPHGAGQRLDTLLGKVLRLDVSAVGEQRPYTIPADNPFTETEGARPEIWATGLRNVWRMSFDPKTGALWAGDVGQNAWEEVDIIKRGGNYGWNEREGSHPFQPTGGDAGRFIEPVFEYGRNLGGSITGGSVYRGDLYPSMDGLYIFGDYMSGRLWAIQQNADGAFQTRDITPKDRRFPSSFGVAPDGTILMCAFSGPYQRTGRIVRLVPRAGSDISP